MHDMQTLTMAIAIALALVVPVIAWLTNRWWYGRKVAEMTQRFRVQERRSLEKITGLISQVDALRRELRGQKELVASMSKKLPAQAVPLAQAEKEAKPLAEPFMGLSQPRKSLGFEDTQIL